MAATRSLRSLPPQLPGQEAPIDHALTLALADDTETALRWSAAAVEREPSTAGTPAALLVTSRLLERMGRMRAAVDGLRLTVQRAIDGRNLPLAIAAVQDLRALGIDASSELDEVAATFNRDSSRLLAGHPAHPEMTDFQPLSPFLAGPSLASRASQAVAAAKRAIDELAPAERPQLAPLPLFSALSKDALRELVSAFETRTVAAGQRVIEEGRLGDAAYFVARGELEISRRAGDAGDGESKPPIAVARLGAGSFFGETALLSQLPAPATVTAIRPCILLVVRRAALEALAAKFPEAASELAAHCRRHTVANLGWTSPVIAAMPPVERSALVERLETRVFAKGERLVTRGEEAGGLHLIVSGEVAVVAADSGERVVLATLGAGETVGEVELVLCRKVNADAIAIRGTVTLYLPREEYLGLVEEYPAILYALYAIAVRRHNETQLALQAGSAFVADEFLDLHDATGRVEVPEQTRVAAVERALEQDPEEEQARITRRPAAPPATTGATTDPLPAPRLTAPLPPPADLPTRAAVPAIPIAPTIILQEEMRAVAAAPSSRPPAPPPDTKRSKYPTVASAQPAQRPSASAPPPARAAVTSVPPAARATGSGPASPPTSISPTSTSVPPTKHTSARPLTASRQTRNAMYAAAVAAGVFGAVVLVSRDNHWGAVANAASEAAREPPLPPPALPMTPEPQPQSVAAPAASLPPAAVVKVPRPEVAQRSAPRQAAAAMPAAATPANATPANATPAALNPAPAPRATAVPVPRPAPRAQAAAAAPAKTAGSTAQVASVEPTAPAAEAKAVTPPNPNAEDEFGGRK
jgi:CRP-like cAMP-binding protein